MYNLLIKPYNTYNYSYVYINNALMYHYFGMNQICIMKIIYIFLFRNNICDYIFCSTIFFNLNFYFNI